MTRLLDCRSAFEYSSMSDEYGIRWVYMSMGAGMIWTAIFVKRGSVELESRQLVGPHDSDKMFEHAIGLIDDGWLLALVKGSHEPYTGSLPVGKRAMDWLRGLSDE